MSMVTVPLGATVMLLFAVSSGRRVHLQQGEIRRFATALVILTHIGNIRRLILGRAEDREAEDASSKAKSGTT